MLVVTIVCFLLHCGLSILPVCLASHGCVKRCNMGLNTGRLQAIKEGSSFHRNSWAFPLATEVKVLEPACVETVPNVSIPPQDWLLPHRPLGQVYWTPECMWPSEHLFPSSVPTPVCSVTAPVFNPRVQIRVLPSTSCF